MSPFLSPDLNNKKVSIEINEWLLFLHRFLSYGLLPHHPIQYDVFKSNDKMQYVCIYMYI